MGELGPAYRADAQSPVTAIAHRSLADAWGEASVEIGVGGSIPFIATLQQTFPGANVLVTGIEDPDSRAHSEDESQHLGELKNAILAEAILLARLGGVLDHPSGSGSGQQKQQSPYRDTGFHQNIAISW